MSSGSDFHANFDDDNNEVKQNPFIREDEEETTVSPTLNAGPAYTEYKPKKRGPSLFGCLLVLLLLAAAVFGLISLNKSLNKPHSNNSHSIDHKSHNSVVSSFINEDNFTKLDQAKKHISHSLAELEDEIFALKANMKKMRWFSGEDKKQLKSKIVNYRSRLNTIENWAKNYVKDPSPVEFSNETTCKTKDAERYLALSFEEIGMELDDMENIVNGNKKLPAAKIISKKPIKKSSTKKYLYKRSKSSKNSVSKSAESKDSKSIEETCKDWCKKHIAEVKKETECERTKAKTHRSTKRHIVVPKPKAIHGHSMKHLKAKKLIQKHNSHESTVSKEIEHKCPSGYLSDFAGRCYPAKDFFYECEPGYELDKKDNYCYPIH